MTSKLDGFSGATARWENEGGHPGSPSNPSLDDLQSELQQHVIVPVKLMVFDWDGYRNSNARAAIAAAKKLVG